VSTGRRNKAEVYDTGGLRYTVLCDLDLDANETNRIDVHSKKTRDVIRTYTYRLVNEEGAPTLEAMITDGEGAEVARMTFRDNPYGEIPKYLLGRGVKLVEDENEELTHVLPFERVYGPAEHKRHECGFDVWEVDGAGRVVPYMEIGFATVFFDEIPDHARECFPETPESFL